MDDDLIDDVFEDEYNPNKYYHNTDTGLNFNESAFLDDLTPSPTSGHPAFRANSSTVVDEGWKSFKIDDADNDFDESILHKVKSKLITNKKNPNIKYDSL